MTRDDFLCAVQTAGDAGQLVDACRRHFLHGTPFIFRERETDFYEFRRRIADRFHVGFHEVFLVGSAKLGFSPHKVKDFDGTSDVDVVIVSSELFERYMERIHDYQRKLRRLRRTVQGKEIVAYHEFLEYAATGWIRPDKMPSAFGMGQVKADWFEFFDSLSNGGSEVGAHKVAAGVFKSYWHLERYFATGLVSLYNSMSRKEKPHGPVIPVTGQSHHP